ncbi:MAG: hypothetical protein PVI30_14460 [Myxococcales bacterium]|jgi:nucleoside phosphorylase
MMASRQSPLLVVAHELELEGLPAEIAQAAAVVGVGLPAATAGTAAALARRRTETVILLGSYGRYPRTPASPESSAQTELLAPDSVQLLDAGVAAREAAFPETMPTSVTPDPELTRELQRATGARGGTLATTLAITTDDGLAFRLASAECEGENLEALGVGLACRAAGVRFAALLGCTNAVGAGGREQWARNHGAASLAVARGLQRWISARA